MKKKIGLKRVAALCFLGAVWYATAATLTAAENLAKLEKTGESKVRVLVFDGG